MVDTAPWNKSPVCKWSCDHHTILMIIKSWMNVLWSTSMGVFYGSCSFCVTLTRVWLDEWLPTGGFVTLKREHTFVRKLSRVSVFQIVLKIYKYTYTFLHKPHQFTKSTVDCVSLLQMVNLCVNLWIPYIISVTILHYGPPHLSINNKWEQI